MPPHRWAGQGETDRRGGDLQYLADRLEPRPQTLGETVAVRGDEHRYFLDWRSSSAPKKDAAAFEISLARASYGSSFFTAAN